MGTIPSIWFARITLVGLLTAAGTAAAAQEPVAAAGGSHSGTTGIGKTWTDIRAIEPAGVVSAAIRQATVRQSDSVLNGALIGAGVAIAGGLFLCTRTEPWENCRDDVGPIVRIGAIGAGIGIVVDALIRSPAADDSSRRSTAVRVVPFLGRGLGGAAVSVGF